MSVSICVITSGERYGAEEFGVWREERDAGEERGGIVAGVGEEDGVEDELGVTAGGERDVLSRELRHGPAAPAGRPFGGTAASERGPFRN